MYHVSSVISITVARVEVVVVIVVISVTVSRDVTEVSGKLLNFWAIISVMIISTKEFAKSGVMGLVAIDQIINVTSIWLLQHMVGSETTVVNALCVKEGSGMSCDVESVDWVLESEVVMVDLVLVEWAVCTGVCFTWHVNPVVWADRWVMWGWEVRISEMFLVVWGIVMRYSWVVRCGDDQGSVMRGFVNWSSVVWSGVYWCIVVGCFLNEVRKSWVSCVMWEIMHSSVWVAFSCMMIIHATIWDVGIEVVWSTEVVIMDQSHSNVCIVISVVSAVVIPISPVTSIEVVSSEIKWV